MGTHNILLFSINLNGAAGAHRRLVLMRRRWDISDPTLPREVAYFIPAPQVGEMEDYELASGSPGDGVCRMIVTIIEWARRNRRLVMFRAAQLRIARARSTISTGAARQSRLGHLRGIPRSGGRSVSAPETLAVVPAVIKE